MKFLNFLLIVLLSSCWVDENGQLRFDRERNQDPIVVRERDTVQILKNINILKQLSRTKVRFEMSFWQDEYTLGTDSRLLLKLKEILEFRNEILVGSDTEQVYLDIKLTEKNIENLESIQLCRLVENWSIYADWSKKSPRSFWKQSGGSFSDCIIGKSFEETFKDEESRYHKAHHNDSEGRLVFNLTNFIRSEVVESGENRGWMLVVHGKKNYRIKGEGSYGTGEHTPRIYWKEIRD